MCFTGCAWGSALAADGIAARKSDGVMVVRAADINRALADRHDDEQ
jgi:hypothetical protein